MKLNTLRDFLAVAERGGVRAAARHLDVPQPAISRSIRELEKELGCVLLERHARGVRLTPMAPCSSGGPMPYAMNCSARATRSAN